MTIISGIGRKALLQFGFLALLGCESTGMFKSRSFYLGFTVGKPSPPSSHLFFDSDIIHYHVDGGVAWTRLLGDTLTSASVLRPSNFENAIAGFPGKIYVSVSPLTATRAELANDNSDPENVVPAGKSLRLSDPPVMAAYVRYCKEIINSFEPAFFNMSSEANLFFYSHPESWTDLVSFHEYVYRELKSAYPDLLIFTSVALEPALENIINGSDHILQRLPILQLIAYSDLFVVSIHPITITTLANSGFKHPFSGAFNISDMPFALSISGDHPWLSSCSPDSAPEENLANNALDEVLTECMKRDAIFVVTSLNSSLRRMPNGTYDGTEMTSEVWRKYLSVDFK